MMGTVKFWTRFVVKATRLISGGDIDSITESVVRFAQDVASVVPNGDKPTLEGNRAGLCVSTHIRCADMNEVESVIDNFRKNGWREGRN